MAGAFGGWRHRASQFYFLIILFSFPLFSPYSLTYTHSCSSLSVPMACALSSSNFVSSWLFETRESFYLLPFVNQISHRPSSRSMAPRSTASIPCQKGTCSSPMEVVAISLLANGAHEDVVKAILYPGSVFSKVEGIVADNEGFSFPDWSTLLKDMNMTVKGNMKERSSAAANVGIVVGSYLCIIGAVFAIFGVMQVSACGMLTLLGYIYTIGGQESDVFALPMFGLAMFCAIGGLLNLEGFFKRGEMLNQSKSTTADKEKKQT